MMQHASSVDYGTGLDSDNPQKLYLNSIGLSASN